ncbi:MAG: hypothetical protein Aurels2KO_58010 [Aureliella sp.]
MEVFCERVGNSIMAYGQDYFRNGTNAAYAVGLCDSNCGTNNAKNCCFVLSDQANDR